MPRQLNSDGLALIKQWEGLKLTSYLDKAGVWTIGYGHTSAAGGMKVTPGLHITQVQADELLKADLQKFCQRVEAAVKVPLTDNQFAALVSFDYNTGAINKASFVTALNKGDYNTVGPGLSKYVFAGGKKVDGLVNRRNAEIGLWSKGAFVHGKDGPVVTAKPPLVTKENITFGAGVIGTIGSYFTSGPLAWAAAAILVGAAGVGLYLWLKSRQ